MGFFSKVGNYLLYTPFDNKALVPQKIAESLLEDEFLIECFSKPIFLNEQIEVSKEEYVEYYDSKINQKELQSSIQEYESNYVNFFTWLNNYINPKVYTICGHAGTGKTTFINHLKREYHNNPDFQEQEWIIMDIEKSIKIIRWFSDVQMQIDNFSLAYKKVYAIIILHIKDYLFKHVDSEGRTDIDLIYQKLVDLINIYDTNYACYYPAGNNFFLQLKDGLKGNDEKVNKIIRTAENCKKYFLKIEKDSSIDEMQAALDVLLLIIRCIYKEKNRFVILFDNIERFIAKDEIYNKDIVEIRKNLISYQISLNELGNIHRYMFKYIMVVRNSTAVMYGLKMQSADELASRLDISTWFNIDDIIRRKWDWYVKRDFKEKSFELVNQITSDMRVCKNKEITGLKLQISPMFNNNMRLIVDFLGMVIEKEENKYVIQKYEDFWNENTSVSKFSARSLIRGLLLKELQESDNMFGHLKAYTYSGEKGGVKRSGIGIARKILTLLYNKLEIEHETYVEFSVILKELLCIYDITSVCNSDEWEEYRKEIAEVLFFMNSYNRRDNDWIQFIDLQIKGKNHNVDLANDEDLKKIIFKNPYNITISIMPAGIAYLKYIVASFEFFSVRYGEDKTYVPLFALIPSPKEIEQCKNFKSLKCFRVIQLVKRKAMECISFMKDDFSLPMFLEERNGKTHTERIIQQHTAYLDLFIRYLKEKYLEDNKEKTRVKMRYRELIDEILFIRNDYRNII